MNWTESTENQSSWCGTFPRTHKTGSLVRSKRRWQRTEWSLNSWKIGSSSCRCLLTSIGWQAGYTETCISNSSEFAACPKTCPEGHWPFLGQGTEETCYGTHTYKPEGLWKRSVQMMMLHLRESGHPIFRAASALDRGSIAEMLCRTIISVSQLSVHGAISDRCEELAQQTTDYPFSRPVANMKVSNLTQRRVNLSESTFDQYSWKYSQF